VAGANKPAAVGWGYIRVPGSWRTGYSPIKIPQMVAPGSGPGWDAWRNDTLLQGWYERPLTVPAGWNARAIVLHLTRVSTDAWVYVDGKEAGRTAWPSGEVDITRLVTPGRTHQLRVYVAAIQTQTEVGNFMGPGAGQVTMQAATLESKGLIDDVLLESRPRRSFRQRCFRPAEHTQKAGDAGRGTGRRDAGGAGETYGAHGAQRARREDVHADHERQGGRRCKR
jgi:hypothetical protein